MGDFLKDIRYGFRLLIKNPGFTSVAVLALALGIGANTAIFSFIDAYLIRPLPFAQPEQLVTLFQNNPSKGLAGSTSFPNFADWRKQNKVFSELSAFSGASADLTGSGGEPERLQGTRVSSGFFDVLGVKPAFGRVFREDEDAAGKDKVVVLGHGFWQRRFAGDGGILGRTVALNGEPHTVIGIMPPDFRFPHAVNDFWAPLALDYGKQHRGNQWLRVMGRLKEGVTIDQARAQMETLAARLEEQYPNENAGWSVGLGRLDDPFRRNARPALLVLLAAVAFVLLIACANVANLLLARAASRSREIAIRAAMGAGRPRVIRQMMTESVLISMLGGLLGLAFASWGVKALAASMPARMSAFRAVELDGVVLVFTFVVAVVTGCLFGLAPAVYASRSNLSDALKEGGRGADSGRASGRLRSVFVVSEVALAMLLLVAAGLMIRSFFELQKVDTGFKTERVLTMGIALPEARYAQQPQRAAFFRQAAERIASLPEVESVGAASILPMSGSNTNSSFDIEGRPEAGPGNWVFAGQRTVTPDYFSALRIGLLRGRYFKVTDVDGAPLVVIINESMARKFWPEEDPLGRRIKVGGSNWSTIVGIVGDVRHSSPATPPMPEMYFPMEQSNSASMNFVVRTTGEPLRIAAAMRAEVRALDAQLPVGQLKTMDQFLSESPNVAQPRLMTSLLGIFGILAMLLAAMGLYGVISYSVVQRTRELGIRVALGAQAGSVLGLVIRQAMGLTAIGIAIGLAGAFAVTRLLASLLYGVSPTDPLIFVGVPVLLALTALAASYVPARRAARVDPIIALRCE